VGNVQSLERIVIMIYSVNCATGGSMHHVKTCQRLTARCWVNWRHVIGFVTCNVSVQKMINSVARLQKFLSWLSVWLSMSSCLFLIIMEHCSYDTCLYFSRECGKRKMQENPGCLNLNLSTLHHWTLHGGLRHPATAVCVLWLLMWLTSISLDVIGFVET